MLAPAVRSEPLRFAHPDNCAAAIIERVGPRVVLALPLGLGKANHIANALYRRAAADPGVRLEVLTALTLEKPHGRPELQQRLLEPIVERLFGDYPDLEYARALREGRLPPNVAVTEFYLQPGGWLNVGPAQRAYTSLNYTHVSRELLRRGVNVLAQLVAKRERGGRERLSLSCNPDVTLDLLPGLEARRASGAPIALAGQVNSRLPFMSGEAEVAAERFDFLLEGPACEHRLFAPPRRAVSLADYAAGLHAASLVKDGGTLQIGIGSIGDAVAYGLILRHREPAAFRAALAAIMSPRPVAGDERELDRFEQGLYAMSEMLVDGFLDLYRAGILKRRVYDDRDEAPMRGRVLHAAFFIGSRALQEALAGLAADGVEDIAMTSVSFTNTLRGAEALKRAQRRDARFINNAMLATLLGDVVSDALADGRVVSGVGGQHDFVVQAHELDGARAIMVLNATRDGAASNIHWTYPRTTIPRHLRDVFVTEYGIADLRGKSDRDCIAAMLALADARHLGALLRCAQRAGKIEGAYRIPEAAQRNSPAWLAAALGPFRAQGLFPDYPFGTDLTPVEQRLARALKRLKRWSRSKPGLALQAARGLLVGAPDEEALARLGLSPPASLRDRLYRALVARAIEAEAEPTVGDGR